MSGLIVTGCPFCEIAEGRPGDSTMLLVEPLNPVTEGHMLVIPRQHFAMATDDPALAAQAFFVAASFFPAPMNIIANVGTEATQTVQHFHLHVVPRQTGDGLTLPWTGQALRSVLPDSIPSNDPLALNPRGR